MKTAEKALLLELILRDIRGDWGYEIDRRVEKALLIATELDLKEHIKSIQDFKKTMREGWHDGRDFRKSYKDGGYENMEELHGLSSSLDGKSEGFEQVALDILNYPELI